jgi:antitoxin YefM
MREISLNKFKANINEIADKVIDDHQAIRINRRSGEDFIVISAEDWEREQEAMSVLDNNIK